MNEPAALRSVIAALDPSADRPLSGIGRVLKLGALLNLRVPYYTAAEAYYLSHLHYFSERWLDQALTIRNFVEIEYVYGWTKDIQDPKNPFHSMWVNPSTRQWCLRHLNNVAWEVWVRCKKGKPACSPS